MSNTYLPKEISWLSFNERVLQEAENKDVPLIERFKFLGIYSNNLDEYFRVRVSTLRKLSQLDPKSNNILGYSPKATLKKIHEIVLQQNTRFEKIYKSLNQELDKLEHVSLVGFELDYEQDTIVLTVTVYASQEIDEKTAQQLGDVVTQSVGEPVTLHLIAIPVSKMEVP